MRGLLFVSLVLGSVASASTQESNVNVSRATIQGGCFPHVYLEQLNSQPDKHIRIFKDYRFGCPGEISAWRYYAGKIGTFMAGVWRQQDDGQVELIGKNVIEVKVPGLQTYMVPGHLRFRARAGDMISIHYSDEASESVVMLDDDRYNVNGRTGLTDTYSSPTTLYDSHLPVGTRAHIFDVKPAGPEDVYNFEKLSHRTMPALQPIYNKMSVRLDGGLSENEGRAMFEANGVWGTICDSNPHNANWPAIFCAQLGYDHVESIDTSHVKDGKGPVTFQNPDCAGSQFMDLCAASGSCNHDNDVYLKCSHAVRLEAGVNGAEGRAMFYNDQQWGTVCAQHNKKQGFASVFCHELGYDHAVKVSKAKDEYVGEGSGDMALTNPVCEANKAQHIPTCGKSKANCNHDKDLFIRCQAGVRLVGGAYEAEGVAEIYKAGSWGKVCTDNIRRDRFPAVFCKQLGYDHVITVDYAVNRMPSAPTGHIADHNPDCGPEYAANVLNCGHPNTKTCDHNKVLYIKCDYEDFCRNTPCQNDAVCINLQNDYKCECRPGFEGPNCEMNIDDCAGKPCLHGGICLDRANGYECKCTDRYTGTHCEHVTITKDPIVLRPVAFPDLAVSIQSNSLSLDKSASIFRFTDGAVPGAVKVMVVSTGKEESKYLFLTGDMVGVSDQKGSLFYPVESERRNLILKPVDRPGHVVVAQDSKLVVITGNMSDSDFTKKAEFYINDLDAENTLIMYSSPSFDGSSYALTGDDADFRNHGFDDALNSFEVKGRFSWQLFEHRDYSGKSVIAQPGRYDATWVNTHLGKEIVSSAKKIESSDGMTIWREEDFKGAHITLSHSHRDITKVLSATGSIEVIGPSSWEMYSNNNFKGQKCVASPGRYNHEWFKTCLESDIIASARKVEVNLPMCHASSGLQTLEGKSGKKHDVFVAHKEDGSAWLRFGVGDMGNTWKMASENAKSMNVSIFDQAAYYAMNDFEIIGWEIDTDLTFHMKRDESWSPSRIAVMYLGSRTMDTFKFSEGDSDKTDLTFSADKMRVSCYGRK